MISSTWLGSCKMAVHDARSVSASASGAMILLAAARRAPSEQAVATVFTRTMAAECTGYSDGDCERSMLASIT